MATIRRISKVRARKLRSRGEDVKWVLEKNSHYWRMGDLTTGAEWSDFYKEVMADVKRKKIAGTW